MLSSQVVNEILKNQGVGGNKYEKAFKEVKKAEDYLDRLNEKLSLCTSLQEAVDEASLYTSCPFFVFDRSYNILAITKNLEFEHDEEWDYMISKGFLSPLTARLMKEEGDLEYLAKSEGPVAFYDPILFPFHSISCNITIDSSFAARVNMLSALREFNETDTDACRIMAFHLARILKENRKNDRNSSLKKMLKDILSGSSFSEEHMKNILAESDLSVKNIFGLYVIELNPGKDPQVPAYYESSLERVMVQENVFSFSYGESLILLSSAPKEKDLGPIEFKLTSFLNTQNLYAGAGGYFKSPKDLRGAYSQALTALKFKKESLFTRYSDIMIENILSYVPSEEIPYAVSDDLFRVLDAEKESSFPMLETLKAYLDCAGSVTNAAKRLYIHKNTLLYRINKIREVLLSDLDDPEECLKLNLSIKLYERKQG